MEGLLGRRWGGAEGDLVETHIADGNMGLADGNRGLAGGLDNMLLHFALSQPHLRCLYSVLMTWP